MILSRTLAVFDKLIKDIKSAIFYTNIVLQYIFLVFYSYSIYSNLSNLPFLIIYSILLVLSILTFINLSVEKLHKEKDLGKFNRFLRIFRYFVKATTIIVTIVEITKFGITDFAKMLFIVSCTSLLLQIILEIIRIFVEKYVELFKISFEKDMSFLTKVKEAKGSVYGLIDVPLEMIANKLEKKEQPLTKKELEIEKLAENYREKQKAKKQEIKEKNVEVQKSEIISHLKTIKNNIFKSKKEDKE